MEAAGKLENLGLLGMDVGLRNPTTVVVEMVIIGSYPNSQDLNIDATWSETHQAGGLEWVLRNWEGGVILAGNRFVNNYLSVKMMEAMTVLEGQNLPFTISCPIQVENDLKMLILLKYNEILHLQVTCGITSFNKVNKDDNVCAHYLARRAFKWEECECWVTCIPDWLVLRRNQNFLSS